MDRTPASVRRAARRVAGRCFRQGTSLFAPPERLWTSARLTDLAARLERAAARAGSRGGRAVPFAERWRRTLARADDDTVALAAEALYVHLLFPTSVRGERKRALLQATMARLTARSIPPELDAALDHGIAPVGPAYTRRRLSQLAWLAAAASRWHHLTAAERRSALDEPRRTAAALARVPVPGGAAQRAALLHLLHADTFASVTSQRVREAILRAFARHVPADERDPDCALAAVRAALVPLYGPDFSFFDPQVAVHWQ